MSSIDHEPEKQRPADQRITAPTESLEASNGNLSTEPPTAPLPPDFILPFRPVAGTALQSAAKAEQHNRLLLVASGILLAALVISGTYFAFRTPGGASTTLSNCTTPNTPCQVTIAYLVAYTGGKYNDLYALTSSASHERFSNPLILNHQYKNAEDYIINRTQDILNEAQIYSISDTIDTTIQTSDTTASVPARIVMQSARVGTIVQNISIPLVKENGKWLVDWSPGLIFSQLDDPAGDPYYTRRVELTVLSAPRGTIYDSQGNVLAEDETVYQIGVVPDQITNASTTLSVLSAQLDLTPSQIQSMYANQPANVFVPIRTITPMLYQQVGSAIGSLPGVQVQQTTGRVYPYGAATAAITGYVAPITATQLEADTSHYYDQSDMVGDAGIEAWGEQYLRPVKGGILNIVNVNADGTDGQPVYSIASQPSAPGQNIHTAISLSEQLATWNSLVKNAGSHGGSAVAIDPTTGNVLAMASTPIYDPNDFSLGFTPNELASFNALDHPYLNRAIQGAYPIGSVFKLVTLSAALSNGVKPTDIFTCDGSYQVPGESVVRQDDKPGGHGNLTVAEALAPSCDVIYWEVAVLLNSKDPNILPNTAKAFGYGSKTGIIGLPSDDENPGTVPTPQSVAQQGSQWSPGNAADLAIGQGDFTATALQIAMVSAALGNAGKRMQPILVSAVTSTTGKATVEFPPKEIGTLPLSADTLAIVQTAMVATTDTTAGTSYDTFHNFPIRVAGKTGTAQSGQPNPHALFTTFAPASPLSGPSVPPQIATSVIIEYIGTGDGYAAPVTLAMLQAFFNIA
ncbi:MAG: penicillin-binding transpeptidase domain-containing protein [Ktedonobacterales bacterium]